MFKLSFVCHIFKGICATSSHPAKELAGKYIISVDTKQSCHTLSSSHRIALNCTKLFPHHSTPYSNMLRHSIDQKHHTRDNFPL